MKSKNSLSKAVMISFLVIGFCIGATQSALAFTTVYLDLVEPYVFVDETTNGIAAIQFDILDPVIADASNFTANFPAGWINFSSGKLISAFDGGGTASIPNGVVGIFDIDVLLSGWELTLQDGLVLTMGNNFPIDYTVIPNGTDYTITNVPIPSALLLLGGGLLGLIGIRRKVNN